MTAAKVVAMTTAAGEGLIETFGTSGSTSVLKDTGSRLAQARIHSSGVLVIPSQDFVGDHHSYDILVAFPSSRSTSHHKLL
jgi:hypothetical protein